MSSARALPRRQRGFALVLALGAIAVVLGLAAALDAWVATRVEQARQIRERVQDGLDAYGTRATLLYLLGTQRYTRAGLTTTEPPEVEGEDIGADLDVDPVGGEIALDGRAYRGLGRIRFALQDQSGLVALNAESQAQLAALLERRTGDPAQAAALLDALADYRDGNAMRRLNGAEQPEYEQAGLPAPANRRLRSAAELRRVYGWQEWLATQPEKDLQQWFTVASIETFNPNSTPASLLASLLPLAPAQVQAILAERARRPFENVPDFNARADVELPLDEEEFRFFPSDSMQIRLWREGAAQAEVLAIQLTPRDRRDPWQVGSSYRITQGPGDTAHEVPGELFGPRPPAAR